MEQRSGHSFEEIHPVMRHMCRFHQEGSTYLVDIDGSLKGIADLIASKISQGLVATRQYSLGDSMGQTGTLRNPIDLTGDRLPNTVRAPILGSINGGDDSSPLRRMILDSDHEEQDDAEIEQLVTERRLLVVSVA